MYKYKCSACDYVYYPNKGEEKTETPKGTKFKELPENWKCPKCSQIKIGFVAIAV
jgi:rubredoxin